MRIEVFCLGAGQEVGRSCVIASFGNEKRVMFDVGIHMGYNDKNKYPDFQLLKDRHGTDDLNQIIDVVCISHFHTDHCAALPILTEFEDFKNPVVASEPTKCIIPYMLEDFIKLNTDRTFDFRQEMAFAAAGKIKVIALRETQVISDMKITTYYAGHILGAVMFCVEYKGIKILYTGDYSSSADRHLRGCEIDPIKPHIVISESTYGTVIREWKKEREMKFMELIKRTFDQGGKVLIPVFATGRAQELFILIEDIWKNAGWTYPVYYSAGLTSQVHFYYRLFVEWMNENVKDRIIKTKRLPFDLSYIQKFERSYAKMDAPMVVLATPGMLHAGMSLSLFKEWCDNPKNSLLIPGYCVEGTVGNLILKGVKHLDLDNKRYEVKMNVSKMAFSAHADHKGITNLIDFLQPQHTVFVHGEAERMKNLSKFIEEKSGIKCHCPANFESLLIDIEENAKVVYELDKSYNEYSTKMIVRTNEHKQKVLEKLPRSKFLIRFSYF